MNQQLLKIFLVLILSTVYIFSFSHFGASAYKQLTHVGEFGENTKIGSLDVSGKDKKEITELLVAASESWKQNTILEIVYKEEKVELSNDMFTFQIDETVSRLQSGQTHIVGVNIDSDALEYQLQSASFLSRNDSVNLEVLINDILNYATKLSEGNHSLHLENYVKKDDSASKTIAKANVAVGSYSEQMKELSSTIKSFEIKGQSQFSLLAKMEELSGSSYSAEVLSRLATAMYEVILPTNFTVLERNISEELPSYADLGVEASINPSLNQDLVFSNVNDMSYHLDLTVKGKQLEVSLIGPSFLNKYEVSKSNRQSYTPKIIKQYSSQLPTGSMQVVEEGKEGMGIKVTRKTITSNGEIIKTEELADDFYPPVHRVEVYSLEVPVVPEESVEIESEDIEENVNSDNPATEDDSGEMSEKDSGGKENKSESSKSGIREEEDQSDDPQK